MSPESPRTTRPIAASVTLIGIVLSIGVLLGAWKYNATVEAAAAAANVPEPAELVTLATAQPRAHRQRTTAIGTVLALQSITLRNELAGTVRRVALTPGAIVDPGAVLVALDVSVEQADLRALEAQATLAQTTLERLERLRRHQATSEEEVDQARAQRDVAQAQVARLEAVIAKKTIRAPFRARVGITDVHVGQFLNEGVVLTTLQGVADAANVDFEVAQDVAAALSVGTSVEVIEDDGRAPLTARVTAVDARINPTTRNATVRARLAAGQDNPRPGAAVRVRVPVGQTATAVAVPVNALRKGPAGDHVWLVTPDSTGTPRAHLRRITSGPVVNDSVVVLDGLRTGDQVAASGSFKLREGLKVYDAAAAEASAATH